MKLILLIFVLLGCTQCSAETTESIVEQREFTEADIEEFGEELLFEIKKAAESKTAFETFDEAKERKRNQRAVMAVVRYLQTHHKEKYAGFEFSVETGGPPILYFKGKMTRRMVRQVKALLPDRTIAIIDQLKYNTHELEDREAQTVELLKQQQLGFVLGVGAGGQYNDVTVLVDQQDYHTSESIRALLPEDLRNNLFIVVPDYALSISH